MTKTSILSDHENVVFTFMNYFQRYKRQLESMQDKYGLDVAQRTIWYQTLKNGILIVGQSAILMY